MIKLIFIGKSCHNKSNIQFQIISKLRPMIGRVCEYWPKKQQFGYTYLYDLTLKINQTLLWLLIPMLFR